MNCKDCPNKRRAGYWYKVATVLLAIIGGIMGSFIAFGCIKLFCN